jgi:hypothetical protein
MISIRMPFWLRLVSLLGAALLCTAVAYMDIVGTIVR